MERPAVPAALPAALPAEHSAAGVGLLSPAATGAPALGAVPEVPDTPDVENVVGELPYVEKAGPFRKVLGSLAKPINACGGCAVRIVTGIITKIKTKVPGVDIPDLDIPEVAAPEDVPADVAVAEAVVSEAAIAEKPLPKAEELVPVELPKLSEVKAEQVTRPEPHLPGIPALPAA